MLDNRSGKLILLAFIVSTILGGNNAIAVRFSNIELPPFFGAAVRFAIAGLILLLVVFFKRLPLPRGMALVGVIIFGALQFGVGFALGYWSLQDVPAGLFQVVLGLVPLFTFIIAILYHQESFQWQVLIGGIVSIIGITIIFRESISATIPLLSLLAIVLAAACFAESIVLVKSFPSSHPISTNAIAMITGSIILIIFSIIFGEVRQIPTMKNTWLALIYLILFGSIGTFGLALYVISKWKASAYSYQLVLMPIVTVLFSAWLTNEVISFTLIYGAIIVLTGVYIGSIMPVGVLKRIFVNHKGVEKIDEVS